MALALGMGAAIAIFSVVDGVLWKPLPFRAPGRLVAIWEKNPALNRPRMFVAPVNFQEWQRQSGTLESSAAILAAKLTLTAGPSGRLEAEELKAERVSASLFPLLGVQPAVGRSFRPEEDEPGRNSVVLLSHSLWTRKLGADESVVGKAIVLSNRSYTVAGVLPRGFSVLDPAVDVWLPLGFDFNNARLAGGRSFAVIARLRDGVAVDRVRAEFETIGSRLEQADPALNKGWRPSVYTLIDELVGDVRQPLLVIAAAVGCLLFMACTNVANLLLARGAGRRKEIAVRISLGAGRWRIVAQLLVESLLLSLAGCALGLMLARGGLALVGWLGTGSIPRLAGAALDWRAVLFALAAATGAAALFGIVPALQVSQMNLNAALEEVPRGGSPGRSGRRMRNALIVAEVSLAVVVLIASGLLIRSFTRLRSADPGFRTENLLTFRLPLAGGRNTPNDRRAPYYTEAASRLAVLPGVRTVSMIDVLPLGGLGGGSVFTVEGRAPLPPDQRPVGLVRFIDGSYFQTMGIPLLAGRSFTAADTKESRPVIMVNRTVTRRFWPEGGGVPAVGGRISLVAANGSVGEIVGVVGDVKSERIEQEDWPTIYYPYTQVAPSSMTMVVKTAGDPRGLISAAAAAIRGQEPDQSMPDILTMEEVVGKAMAGSQFNTVVLGVFASIAFLLAAVGIYGVVSYDVSQRTGEIGIRMALGAEKRDVLKLVLGQGARLAALGIGIGLAAAFGLTRLMSTMLYGVRASDAVTYGAISLLLGLVALAASYLPSRRAMAVNPVTALRHE